MQEMKLVWHTQRGGSERKTSSWYWTIAIVAGGITVASFIAGNLLFGLLAVIGAFAIMLAGSQPNAQEKCAISERGVHVGSSLIPFPNISRFAIEEGEPMKLKLQTKGLVGIISLGLEGVDFRGVRSELKNNNVEEVDKLGSLSEKIAETIGM